MPAYNCYFFTASSFWQDTHAGFFEKFTYEVSRLTFDRSKILVYFKNFSVENKIF